MSSASTTARSISNSDSKTMTAATAVRYIFRLHFSFSSTFISWPSKIGNTSGRPPYYCGVAMSSTHPRMCFSPFFFSSGLRQSNKRKTTLVGAKKTHHLSFPWRNDGPKNIDKHQPTYLKFVKRFGSTVVASTVD